MTDVATPNGTDAGRIEQVQDRVLADTPLAGLVDATGLARAIAASFIVPLEAFGSATARSATPRP